VKVKEVDLEILDHGTYSNFGKDNDKMVLLRAIDKAVLHLVKAMSNCSQLETLKLPIARYSEPLDQALARLISSKASNVKSLTLTRPIVLSDEAKLNAPMLLKAIKSCCTITSVFLKMYHWPNYVIADPWAVDLKRSIETIVRLNGAGRNYLLDSPGNQIAGFSVLEQVNDDLDCLFYHLRENPLLCHVHRTPSKRPRDSVGMWHGRRSNCKM
jgi:hypothetical protein